MTRLSLFQLAVDVLKLAQLCVEYFLAPNLALLVDTMAGSEMQKLGPNILKRMHDPNWEVRDSAIELLTSLAKISIYSEFDGESITSFFAYQFRMLQNSQHSRSTL